MSKLFRWEDAHFFYKEEPIEVSVCQELVMSSKQMYGYDDEPYDKPLLKYETTVDIKTIKRKPREMTLLETLCVFGCPIAAAEKIERCLKYGDKIPRKYRKYKKYIK